MAGVLLTGFEAFDGHTANPSGEAVRLVASRWRGQARLHVDVLPVTFAGAAARLRDLIATHRPDVVVCTGLAGGRDAVTVERIAVNLIDARIPDNDGVQPVDARCVADGPVAWLSTLPVKAVVRDVGTAGIPCRLSLSAGTFVCNHVFATAMDAAGPGVRAGFIHVPWGRGQAPHGEPELAVRDTAAALAIACRTALEAASAGGRAGAEHETGARR